MLYEVITLGPFANAYWGHKTYRFTPEQNLIALSHYLKALEVQRMAAQMLAIFGGKQPHPQSLVIGGVSCVMDILDPSRMGEYMVKFQKMQDFVTNAYLADVKMAAEMYASEPSVTKPIGVKNFIAYQEFKVGRDQYLFDGGYILDNDISKVFEINERLITEEATHSWYKDDGPQHPYEGTTVPNPTGYVITSYSIHYTKLYDYKVIDTFFLVRFKMPI